MCPSPRRRQYDCYSAVVPTEWSPQGSQGGGDGEDNLLLATQPYTPTNVLQQKDYIEENQRMEGKETEDGRENPR